MKDEKDCKRFLLSPFSSLQSGFTLIELLIVFAILMSLSLVGIASVGEYARKQTVATAAKDVASVLLSARAKATTQVKPDDCKNPQRVLGGYEVSFENDGTYTIAAVCNEINYVLKDGVKKLPNNHTFSSAPQKFEFLVISGGVTGVDPLDVDGTDVVIANENGDSRKVTLFRDGRIIIQN